MFETHFPFFMLILSYDRIVAKELFMCMTKGLLSEVLLLGGGKMKKVGNKYIVDGYDVYDDAGIRMDIIEYWEEEQYHRNQMGTPHTVSRNIDMDTETMRLSMRRGTDFHECGRVMKSHDSWKTHRREQYRS